MKLHLLFIIAVTLAMDAFAVSITNGIATGVKPKKRVIFQVAFSFGLAQAIMPFIGYFTGRIFADYIRGFDHWVAFILLGVIGANMIYDAICEIKCGGTPSDNVISLKTIVLQSIATSIDALAVGVSFAVLDVNIFYAVFIIGIVTFVLCIIGGFIGNRVGGIFKEKAAIIGGVVLILVGIHILLEHMMFF